MIGIVVVVYNRLDLTQACLASIAEHTPMEHRVIVVDNNSTDGTAEWLTEQGIVNVRLTENVGWGRGANIGAQLCLEDLCAHLNNDTLVRAGWLEPLVAAMDDPAVGIASSRLVNEDGTLQHAGIRLFFDDQGVLTAANITEDPTPDPQAASMAACVVRQPTFFSLGGIDPWFWNGYEDVDFCLRLLTAGGKVRYVAESEVMHIAHASGPERWSHVGENISRLHERWAERMDTR